MREEYQMPYQNSTHDLTDPEALNARWSGTTEHGVYAIDADNLLNDLYEVGIYGEAANEYLQAPPAAYLLPTFVERYRAELEGVWPEPPEEAVVYAGNCPVCWPTLSSVRLDVETGQVLGCMRGCPTALIRDAWMADSEADRASIAESHQRRNLTAVRDAIHRGTLRAVGRIASAWRLPNLAAEYGVSYVDVPWTSGENNELGARHEF